MQSRHATPMTRIESPQQISYLLAPALAQDDSIGPHAQCGLDQIDKPHAPRSFNVGLSDSQGNHISMPGNTTKLTDFLHDDQPLLLRTHAQQSPQECGLADTRATGNQNAGPIDHQRPKNEEPAGGTQPGSSQLLQTGRVSVGQPDGNGGALGNERSQYSVDSDPLSAGSVGHGTSIVEATPQLSA